MRGELLENDDGGSEVLLRHCRHFVALAETGDPAPSHPRRGGVDGGGSTRRSDNFRAALDWALSEGQPALAVRLAGRLGRYWELRGACGGRRPLARGGDRIGRRGGAARGSRAGAQGRGGHARGPGVVVRRRRIPSDQLEHRLSRRSRCLAAPATRLESPTRSCTSAVSSRTSPSRRGRWQRRRSRMPARPPTMRSSPTRSHFGRCSFRIVDVDAEIAEAAALYRERRGRPRTCRALQRRRLSGHGAGQLRARGPRTSTKRSCSREDGEQLRVVLAFGNLGLASLFTGGSRTSCPRAFAEELRLVTRARPWPGSEREALAGLAAVAACQGELERAARLRGAAESIGECPRAMRAASGSSRSSSRRLGSEWARGAGTPRTRREPGSTSTRP